MLKNWKQNIFTVNESSYSVRVRGFSQSVRYTAAREEKQSLSNFTWWLWIQIHLSNTYLRKKKICRKASLKSMVLCWKYAFFVKLRSLSVFPTTLVFTNNYWVTTFLIYSPQEYWVGGRLTFKSPPTNGGFTGIIKQDVEEGKFLQVTTKEYVKYKQTGRLRTFTLIVPNYDDDTFVKVYHPSSVNQSSKNLQIHQKFRSCGILRNLLFLSEKKL